MSYRRDRLNAEVAEAIELVSEDESWQGAFDDNERMILLNFATGYIRAFAYRQRSPRAAALRVLKMLRAASNAVAEESPQSFVQTALKEPSTTNEESSTTNDDKAT
jgi:hypothetical protein